MPRTLKIPPIQWVDEYFKDLKPLTNVRGYWDIGSRDSRVEPVNNPTNEVNEWESMGWRIYTNPYLGRHDYNFAESYQALCNMKYLNPSESPKMIKYYLPRD